MKVGDLVKVKDVCAFGNVYMQSIAGWIALLLERKPDGQMLILTQGRAWRVSHSDLEVI